MWIITQSLLVLAMGMQLTGCTTVRHQLGRVLISDETEYALGAQLAAHIDTTQTSLDNSNIQRYVERIAAPLVERAQVDRPGATYRFTVLDDPTQVNAFAVPGGFLYVYSGLIIAAEDEAELPACSPTKLDTSSGATRPINSPLSLGYSYSALLL